MSESPTAQSTSPESGRTGVILVHGLTGTPSEMKPVAKHLLSLGFRVDTPMLAGHGAGHVELLKATDKDWLATVRESVKAMAVDCDVIVIAGLSMGALLAALIAAEDPRVSGIVMMSTTLGVPGKDIPWTRHLLPLGFSIPLMRRYCYWTERPPYGLKDERLQKMITRAIEASKKRESSSYGLFRTYVGSLHQLDKLMKQFNREAHRAQCPALILHSEEDTIAGPKNATLAYEKLGSRQKSVELITGCDHVMTVDLKKAEVAGRIGQFVTSLRTSAPQETTPCGSGVLRHEHPA